MKLFGRDLTEIKTDFDFRVFSTELHEAVKCTNSKKTPDKFHSVKLLKTCKFGTIHVGRNRNTNYKNVKYTKAKEDFYKSNQFHENVCNMDMVPELKNIFEDHNKKIGQVYEFSNSQLSDTLFEFIKVYTDLHNTVLYVVKLKKLSVITEESYHNHEGILNFYRFELEEDEFPKNVTVSRISDSNRKVRVQFPIKRLKKMVSKNESSFQ